MGFKRFKVTTFKNPSGTKAYRVSDTLDGKTIRKNFKTRDAATDCQQQLEIKYMEQESEGQTVWTTLTHDQNRDAIAAVNMLKRSKSSKPLTFAVPLLSGSLQRVCGERRRGGQFLVDRAEGRGVA